MIEPTPPQADSIVESIRIGMQAERDKLAVERLAIADEKLRLKDVEQEITARTTPGWWQEWIKPAPIFMAAGVLFGGFQIYQSDKASIQARFQEQGAAILSITTEMRSSVKAAEDRATKYVPIIESDRAAIEAQKLINDQTSDRMNGIVTGLGDLRRSVEVLRDTVQKTHEEMMMERARREGRNAPGVRSDRSGAGADGLAMER